VADDSEEDAELVLAFLNTVDAEEGTDLLDHPVAWRHWVRDRRLGVAGSPGQVRAARDALRAAVAGDADTGWSGQTLVVHVEAGRPVVVPADAVATVLAAAVRLAVTGAWDRLKICPAHDCRWAFYDRSKNRSRTWCSMQVCGNREKSRTFRARSRDART